MFSPNHDWAEVKEVSKSYINVPFFLHFASPPSSFTVGSAGLLYEQLKQYPVLYNKKMKASRDQDVVSNVWNRG